jgi:diketogulonate reductase-like aldo/keto reductase
MQLCIDTNAYKLHPWCQQKDAVKYCQDNNIVVEAYCPLVRNQKASDPTLQSIAKKHGVTDAQVLVRWSLQRGFVPLPKSDTPSRIELDGDDMAQLDGLDQAAEGALVQAVTNE